MTLDDFYDLAAADADRRDLADLTPVLKGLRAAAAALRAAPWNDDAQRINAGGDSASGTRRRTAAARSPQPLDINAGRDAIAAVAAGIVVNTPVAVPNPTSLTIVDAARRLRDGSLTSAALTEACLARIARDNERLNAFILVTAEAARAQAAAADRELASGQDRGALHGIPIAIKDIVDIEGLADDVRVAREGGARRGEGRGGGRASAARGRGDHRQDEPARVRDGHDQRGLGVRRGASSARRHAVARRIERRVGDRRGLRHEPRRGRHRHRRIDSHSLGGLRTGGDQAGVQRAVV